MQTPLHETSDDPRAYRREQQIASTARALSELLVRATGGHALPRVSLSTQLIELLRAAEERDAQLAHFVALAREGRALWPGRWQPSALLLRALARRGLTWADVEARL